jgi:hypothetical protein
MLDRSEKRNAIRLQIDFSSTGFAPLSDEEVQSPLAPRSRGTTSEGELTREVESEAQGSSCK